MNFLRILVFTLLAMALVASLADASPRPRRRKPIPPPKKYTPPPKKHIPPPKKHLPPKKHVPHVPYYPKNHAPQVPYYPKKHAPPILPKYHVPVPPKYTPPRPKYSPCTIGTFNHGWHDYLPGSGTARFNCNAGYYLNGHQQLNCANGHWNHKLPNCVPPSKYGSPYGNGGYLGDLFGY